MLLEAANDFGVDLTRSFMIGDKLSDIQAGTKAQFLVDAGIAERKTAANYLKELEDIGILQNYKVGKEKLYMNKELFEVLSK